MIIARAPLRISLGGGGTDLPSYYREHEGFLVAAAIDRYVYITLHNTFQPGLILKYSKMETVDGVHEIEHPIMREALKIVGIQDRLEVTSMADIPAGTGLGSSGSFTTALLRALHALKKNLIDARGVAEQACDIEINRLMEPVGKQDQYIASFGGVTCFRFRKDDGVDVWPAPLSSETLTNLEDGLVMFFTGQTRSASAILKDQDDRSKKKDSSVIDNLHYTKDLGVRSLGALEKGELHEFGKLMHEHWQHKKMRSGGMSNPSVDHWYDIGMDNGAVGGKLIGAGGGGFLMFYTEDKKRVRHAMIAEGLQEVRIRFDFEGAKTIVQ